MSHLFLNFLSHTVSSLLDGMDTDDDSFRVQSSHSQDLEVFGIIHGGSTQSTSAFPDTSLFASDVLQDSVLEQLFFNKTLIPSTLKRSASHLANVGSFLTVIVTSGDFEVSREKRRD
jgi:hypothetical protein